MRVLIADDHEVVRVGIQKLLIETYDDVVTAEADNGLKLIETLNKEVFDILILDVSMPDFDPLSQIRSIKKQYERMHILIVSAHDDDAYVRGLLGAGVQGYHLKDQPFRDLIIAIERILDGEMWLSSPLIKKLSTIEPKTVQLSPRQIDIALALANGLSNKEISQQLTLSIKTIENHLTRLYHQLDVNSRLEAVKFIREHPQLLGKNNHTIQQSHDYYPQTSASGHAIVVVDDNKRFRQKLISIIGRNFPNLSIYEAGNSQKLQLIIEQITPVMLFMDVVLGDENGINIARKIKHTLPDAKIILITAYPDREFHRLGVEAGALALIDKKDLDKSTIKQIVDDVI